jgi:hypothetical protein
MASSSRVLPVARMQMANNQLHLCTYRIYGECQYRTYIKAVIYVTIRAMTLVLPLQRAERVASILGHRSGNAASDAVPQCATYVPT